MKTWPGRCHCGRVQFEITTDLEWASQCNCSLCTRKAYLHHMVPPERFRLVSGEADLGTYQFGTMTARHHFCRHCGVATYIRPRADPTKYMVNVRCLEGVDLDTLTIKRFDGRSWELRPDAPYDGPWKGAHG